MKNYILYTFIFFAIVSCSKKETHVSDPCSKYEDKIETLLIESMRDSIEFEMLRDEYEKLWLENQIFSSMFSQIESEPGGHKILKKLWENNQYYE